MADQMNNMSFPLLSEPLSPKLGINKLQHLEAHAFHEFYWLPVDITAPTPKKVALKAGLVRFLVSSRASHRPA